MSKENSKTPISKATNVAGDINDDNRITSEFIIVSSDNQSEAENHDFISNEIVVAPSTTEKKPSSKDQNKRKGGPSAKTLNLIKQKQIERKNAELEAEEKAKEEHRLQEKRDREEQEKLRLAFEIREKRKEKEKRRIQRQKANGLYLTEEQREKYHRARVQLEAAGIQVPTRHVAQLKISNNNDQSTKKRILYDDHHGKKMSNITTELVTTAVELEEKVPIEEENTLTDSWEQILLEENKDNDKYQKLNTSEDSESEDQLEVFANESSESESICTEDDASTNVLRAPILCVMGHVDAGKTTILDNLRQTNVQNNEAGGITQQIGATNVPLETIHDRTKTCRKLVSQEGDFLVPGLLIIDTPGHETFKNLRLRGSSLCDLAILIVDIMHGLAPQTIESIELLIKKQTPFIIALNKVDLIYGWKSNKEKDIELVLQEQDAFTLNYFERQCNEIIVQFAKQGLNVALYYKNSDPTEFYSMVPTSARTGDGMGSLIALIIEKCQTTLAQRITFTNELQATVMEVKTTDGFGTTIDVALVNGYLSIGDKIVIAGQESPIVTRIRGLLIPESNQELRVTDQYQTCEKIKGSCGIKIIAKDLEKALPGFPLFVVQNDDEIDCYKNEIENMLKTALNSIKLKDEGVYVQASTLGSLEAFLQLLQTSHIPYSGINIGPVHRKDVIRASTQLEKDVELGTILAFDVKIEKDAHDYAKTIGVKILQNDEIYQLRDMFESYRQGIRKINQEKYRHLAVFPCKLKILPQYVFNTRDPIICGVRVEDGFIKLGTPICILSKDAGIIDLGRVTSIEKNNKSLDIARKGSEVCIKIEPTLGETPKMYGRHFNENDILMSKTSRESIDILKKYFRDEMEISDWKLIIQFKKIFNII